ncbi:MAG: hypothetical protein ACYC1Q_06065 [Bacteroidia bacterium]
MNKRMVYRFSWKALLCSLFVLSSGNSRVFAQNSVFMSLYESGDTKQWALDLAKLEPGASLYLILSDSSNLDQWQEFGGKSLVGLFDYAMPRFTLEYDSFDCLERTLLADSDSTQDHVRGSGEILGIPGSPLKRELTARGQTTDLSICYLAGQELQAFSAWLREGQFVIEIRLNEDAIKGKRVLLFDQEGSFVPNCFYRINKTILPLSVHLFSMDEKERILAQNWKKQPGKIMLPPEVMRQRRVFQDTLMRYWEDTPEPVLVYCWDIGLEGGDKCAPCVAPPPDFSLLQSLGMDSMPEHLYVNYSIFSPASPRELVHIPYEAFQWVFEMHEPAKGFLNCDEAVLYREMVRKRQELELKNLRDLLGDKAILFIF